MLLRRPADAALAVGLLATCACAGGGGAQVFPEIDFARLEQLDQAEVDGKGTGLSRPVAEDVQGLDGRG